MARTVTMASPPTLHKSLTCGETPRLLARSNTAMDPPNGRRMQFLGPPVLSRSCTLPAAGYVAAPAPKVNTSMATKETVAGLYQFLQERGLERYYADAVSWCRLSGAAFLDEVRENLEEMGKFLNLAEADEKSLSGDPCVPHPSKSQKGTLHKAVTLIPGSIQEPKPVVFSSFLDRTCTVPVTQVEAGLAARHVEKAYIPLRAWPVRTAGGTSPEPCKRPASAKDQPSLSFSANTTDLQECLTSRQIKREGPNFYRMRQWTPPRYRERADTVHVIKMRMAQPQAFDVSGPRQAQAALKTTNEEEVADRIISSQPRERDAEPTSFQGVQQAFLRQHGPQIKQEMPGVKLIPTQVGHGVSQRFMKALESQELEVLPAYHGTKASNILGIQRQGLLIPGHGGVTVAHGSAHGVGIYTAAMGNSSLSRSFCDSDEFLVCGVADSRTTPAPEGEPAAAKAFVTTTSPAQSGPRFHRTSQKPASSSAPAAQNTMLGNFTLHKENKEVRHVGGAMVVFDESRVAPLFVAQGIGNRDTGTSQLSQNSLWPTGGTPNDQSASLSAGGNWMGRDQVMIGDKAFWVPPEHWRDDDAPALRHRWTAKARDVERRSQRDAKMAGDSQRE